MDISSLNFVAILAAAIAAFVIGAVYYGIVGKAWMKAARIDPAGAKMSASLFVTSFIAELLMAFVFSALLGGVTMGEPSIEAGVFWGVLIWLGFVFATMTVNQRYQGFGWNLTIIDGIHWLLVFLAMGAVLGWFGAPVAEIA